MKTLFPFAVVVVLTLAACAFVPKSNLRLDEARAMHTAAMADTRLRELASAELNRASEVFEKAVTAWNTLDDPAVVDHLAYLAKQRLAIAHETARRVSAEALVAAASENREVKLARTVTR